MGSEKDNSTTYLFCQCLESWTFFSAALMWSDSLRCRMGLQLPS